MLIEHARAYIHASESPDLPGSWTDLIPSTASPAIAIAATLHNLGTAACRTDVMVLEPDGTEWFLCQEVELRRGEQRDFTTVPYPIPRGSRVCARTRSSHPRNQVVVSVALTSRQPARDAGPTTDGRP